LHVNFLSQYFQLNPKNIHPIPVGADETWRDSSHQTSLEILEVLFYGSFLPLHGMSVMLEAIAHLKNQPIHFTFIGGTGYHLREFNRLKTKFRLSSEQITHIQWVNFSDLRSHYIAKADLGLGGPFGNTPQAQRVITGKTSQFLAMAKPTVVGAIAESVGFLHQKNCLLVEQGNVEALVKTIEWANEHREQLVNIGHAGLELYQTTLSVAKITHRLETILNLC
jgi:glycosyltransferase involved in cell wall biosynthesis